GAEGGAVERAGEERAVALAGVERRADHERPAHLREVDTAARHGRLRPRGRAGEAAVARVRADAERPQVAGERADVPGRDRLAADLRHQGDAVADDTVDVGGVAADPEAVLGGEQRPNAGAARVAARVPGERHAVHRVEGGDAHPADGARAGGIARERVVLPALVAAGVDGGAGHGDLGDAVAAAVVRPGGQLAGAARVALPARDRVAQDARARAAEERAGVTDDEVAAVGRPLDVAD